MLYDVRIILIDNQKNFDLHSLGLFSLFLDVFDVYMQREVNITLMTHFLEHFYYACVLF